MITLTEEQINILSPAVHATWDYISADMPMDIDNDTAIEMVIDADRMATMGFGLADSLTKRLLKDNTVDEVFETFGKQFTLVW